MDSTISQRSLVSMGLVRAPSRKLSFEAWALISQTGFVAHAEGESGGPTAETRILAQARLARDRLGRSGAPDEAGTMPLVIRPMPEGGSQRMLLVLGHGGESPGFHVAVWLPAEVFSALKTDTEAGRIGHAAFTATTNLWIAGSQEHAPTEAQVTWLLGRDEDDAPQEARGLVERIDWSAAILPGTEQHQAHKDEAEQDKALDYPSQPDQPAQSYKPAGNDEPEETTAEALGSVNWSLRQIVLVLIFLLIVIALK